MVHVEVFERATHRKDDLVRVDQRMDLHLLDHFPFDKHLLLRLRTTIPSSAPVEQLFSFVGH